MTIPSVDWSTFDLQSERRVKTAWHFWVLEDGVASARAPTVSECFLISLRVALLCFWIIAFWHPAVESSLDNFPHRKGHGDVCHACPIQEVQQLLIKETKKMKKKLWMMLGLLQRRGKTLAPNTLPDEMCSLSAWRLHIFGGNRKPLRSQRPDRLATLARMKNLLWHT